MHPFSVLTLGIFVAGFITARWDLVTRLYELAIFAADHGVLGSMPSLRKLIEYRGLLLTFHRLGPLEDSLFSHWASFFSSCPLNVLRPARQTM